MNVLLGRIIRTARPAIYYAPIALIIALFCSGLSAAEEQPRDGRIKLHVKASDPNGGKLTFKWTQTEGPQAKILDATAAKYDDNNKKWLSDTFFIPTKAGVYSFLVTVRNEDGQETKKTYILEARKSSSE